MMGLSSLARIEGTHGYAHHHVCLMLEVRHRRLQDGEPYGPAIMSLPRAQVSSAIASIVERKLDA